MLSCLTYVQIFFTFWQGFIISVLHYCGVLGDIGGWDSAHVSDGLQVGWISAFLLNIRQIALKIIFCASCRFIAKDFLLIVEMGEFRTAFV